MTDIDGKDCGTCGRQFKTEQDFLTKTSRWRVCARGNLWFNCGCNSTIMVKKGRFDWYSPEKFMSPGARSVFNRLPGVKDLPHIPTSVMEIQTLLQDKNVTARQLGSAVKNDPLIAGNLLQIANNLKIGGGKKIDSLEHAVTFVGFKTISDILLTISVSSFTFKCLRFNADSFWQESFLTGMVAEHLGRKFNRALLSDEVYLGGCLANVGKVVQAICLPDETDRVADDIANPKNPKHWAQAETDHKVYEHGILGEIAAGFWGLPQYVVDAAGTHHSPEFGTLKGVPPDLTEIVRFANQLTHWLLFQPSRMDKKVYEKCLSQFELTEKILEQTIDELMPLKAHVEAMRIGVK